MTMTDDLLPEGLADNLPAQSALLTRAMRAALESMAYQTRDVVESMEADTGKKTTKGYLRADFTDAWSRYIPSNGNNGNKSSAPHNDGVNAVTDTGNVTPSGADLLPIGQPSSSASAPGGRHIVTDVTDKDGDQGRIWEADL